MNSGQQLLSLSEKKYQAVWDHGADAMLFLDRDGVLDCNESGLRLFGLAEREVMLGRSLADFAPPQQPHGKASGEYLAQQVAATLEHGRSQFECQLRRGDGSLFVADVRLHRIDIGGGLTAHAVLRDVTHRWNVEQRLRSTKDAIEASLHQLVYFDNLTGLPNRAQLFEAAPLTLAQAAAAGRPLALCCVAVTDIEAIKRALGHEAGDAVLKHVAERLRAALPPADVLARVGDNLFCVLQDDCSAERAQRSAQALVAACADPLTLDGRDIAAGVAVGISLLGAHGQDLWTLLQHAETAL